MYTAFDPSDWSAPPDVMKVYTVGVFKNCKVVSTKCTVTSASVIAITAPGYEVEPHVAQSVQSVPALQYAGTSHAPSLLYVQESSSLDPELQTSQKELIGTGVGAVGEVVGAVGAVDGAVGALVGTVQVPQSVQSVPALQYVGTSQ